MILIWSIVILMVLWLIGDIKYVWCFGNISGDLIVLNIWLFIEVIFVICIVLSEGCISVLFSVLL